MNSVIASNLQVFLYYTYFGFKSIPEHGKFRRVLYTDKNLYKIFFYFQQKNKNVHLEEYFLSTSLRESGYYTYLIGPGLWLSSIKCFCKPSGFHFEQNIWSWNMFILLGLYVSSFIIGQYTIHDKNIYMNIRHTTVISIVKIEMKKTKQNSNKTNKFYVFYIILQF